MIIRKATYQDASELTEFNISMARETEGLELIPEVIGAGVRSMIDNPQMGFYLVVELDNDIQASLMVTTGTAAFFSACPTSTVDGARPLACAVRT